MTKAKDLAKFICIRLHVIAKLLRFRAPDVLTLWSGFDFILEFFFSKKDSQSGRRIRGIQSLIAKEHGSFAYHLHTGRRGPESARQLICICSFE